MIALLLAPVAEATEAAWARIGNGGYTILLRHTQMLGSRDPPGVDISDCSTQANLSDNGRQQARRQGTRFAARAVNLTAIIASPYCRTLETADLAFGSYPVEESAALNPLEASDDEAAQIDAMIALINGFQGPGNQVLITHAGNIRALTGSDAREGEAIILAPVPEGGELPEIVGRILLN
ncbi:histidine phosphatase family protein [Pararhizobium haloflavum]|uniref:histidine phosphatase family protein n=1 Tax=Pararhizobium haloflavum TaxID=2037914 RepID=UPI001FE0A828|nr:histidine phosphatase family protein [Pararhizobium haloflavum]